MTTPHHADDRVTLHHGDCLDVLRQLPDCSVDSVVTDPPYGIGFMGKAWDAKFIGDTIEKRRTYSGDPSPRSGVNGGYRSAAAEAGRYDLSPSANREFQFWCEAWARECLRVLKPGGHLLASGSSRTWHRLASAIEDAGFEIRDSIAWLYGSGFPKSLDVSKAIDKAAGAERTEVIGTRGLARWKDGAPAGDAMKDDGGIRQNFDKVNTLHAPATPDAERWQGWGTALKPAFEPVVVGRKPLTGTVAQNVLTHGTGALNIDGCRIDGGTRPLIVKTGAKSPGSSFDTAHSKADPNGTTAGRWPANVVLDESQADALDLSTADLKGGVSVNRNRRPGAHSGNTIYGARAVDTEDATYGDSGGASRFFVKASWTDDDREFEGLLLDARFKYVAKAPKSERPRTDDGTAHPTVKPLALMRWLVRLVTPPGGTVLEPFAGSGTTVEACLLEGFHCIAIEREADYLPLIEARIARVGELPAPDLGLLAFLDDGEAS